MKKNVALVLSSGGPRGFAYIGAIEALIDMGYTITSVTGASIGKNHFVKGDRIINAIKEVVPEVNIEELPLPYRAIATDLYTGEEVIFDHGKLFTAIRASISIPSLFKPVKYGMRTLIDGAIANSLPVNRAVRTEDDIVVAFNVNHIDVEGIREIVQRDYDRRQADGQFQQAKRTEIIEAFDDLRNDTDVSLLKRLKHVGSRSTSILREVIHYQKERSDDEEDIEYGENYYDLLDRTFSLMNYKKNELTLALYQPDIVARMPFDSYGDIADYAKAREIADMGYKLMFKELLRYERGG